LASFSIGNRFLIHRKFHSRLTGYPFSVCRLLGSFEILGDTVGDKPKIHPKFCASPCASF